MRPERVRRRLLAAASALAVAAAAPAPGELAAAGIEIVVCGVYDDCFGAVEVCGLPPATVDALSARRPGAEEWGRAFAVRVADLLAADDPPPVLGDHEIAGGALRFVPRFPFDGGLAYVAHLDGAALDRLAGLPAGTTPSLNRRFTLPPAFAEPNVVSAVHPGGGAVPANLLRLYVHFRFPVFAKSVHRHVHLLDEEGHEVPLAFVEVEGGLWDPEQKRLTLLLHPGRVKRGVAPGEEMGPVLTPGHRYTLRIDRELRDGHGNPMREPFTHGFEVTTPDREPPDPASWELTPPATATAPLEVGLDGPLDHALAERLIAVLDPLGEPLPGRTELQEGDTRWLFHPVAPWRPGAHTLAVHPSLEDPAGNRPGRPFDRDLKAPDATPPTLGIPFTTGDSPEP